MSYGAVGHKFNARELIILNETSLNRDIRKTRLGIDHLMKMW